MTPLETLIASISKLTQPRPSAYHVNVHLHQLADIVDPYLAHLGNELIRLGDITHHGETEIRALTNRPIRNLDLAGYLEDDDGPYDDWKEHHLTKGELL